MQRKIPALGTLLTILLLFSGRAEANLSSQLLLLRTAADENAATEQVAVRRVVRPVRPVVRPVVRRPIVIVRPWVRRPYYGTIVAGVALGTILTAAAVGVAPAPPSPDLCWSWTDELQRQGYWDYCGK